MMNIYVVKNDYDKAISVGYDAITLCPNIAFAATRLGDIFRLKNKWAIASVWYEYAVRSPHGPVLFDFKDQRTIIPLRWLSVACHKLGRIEEAREWHKEAGECEIQDGLQEHNEKFIIGEANAISSSGSGV